MACVQVDRVGLALRSDSHRANRSRLFDFREPVLSSHASCLYLEVEGAGGNQKTDDAHSE